MRARVVDGAQYPASPVNPNAAGLSRLFRPTLAASPVYTGVLGADSSHRAHSGASGAAGEGSDDNIMLLSPGEDVTEASQAKKRRIEAVMPLFSSLRPTHVRSCGCGRRPPPSPWRAPTSTRVAVAT